MKKIVFLLITLLMVSIFPLISFATNAASTANSASSVCVEVSQGISFIKNIETYIYTNSGYKKFAVRELWQDARGNLFVLYRGTYSNITAPVTYASNNPYFKYAFYMSGGWEYFN